MIEKLILYLSIEKGIIIGLVAGMLKIFSAINKGKFNWSKAMVGLASATLMGYFIYNLGINAGMSMSIIIPATAISSFNSFLIVDLITDPKLLSLLVDKYVKK
ncbi:MAG: hypothetical protein ACTSQE_14385 [Candidatus Heimdallarchaeaceae archaeon]